MAHHLNVWMNGLLVGVWSQSNTGVHAFQYHPDWVASEFARPLSNSMPINPYDGMVRGEEVKNYFDNLLPDSIEIRKRIQSNFNTRTSDTIELLEAVGRDCVGAIQLLSLDEEPTGYNQLSSRPLSDEEVAKILLAASTGRVMGQEFHEEEFRISIAGAQEKTALLNLNGAWHLPLGATPTTHILKLALGVVGGEHKFDMTTSIENEWLCAQILAKLGFKIARTEIREFNGTKALVVERFDRKWVDNNAWIARLPQEDFCQVFGCNAETKYEDKGGPGIEKIMSYLTASEVADEDRINFIKAQFVFWLLAGTDGHAKNFSVAIEPQGKFRLTPLYDVLSAWPIIGNKTNNLQYKKAKLAMAVRTKNAHYKLDEIYPRHWQEFTKKLGVPDSYAQMHDIAGQIISVIEGMYDEVPKGFPTKLIDSILDGVSKHVKRFKS